MAGPSIFRSVNICARYLNNHNPLVKHKHCEKKKKNKFKNSYPPNSAIYLLFYWLLSDPYYFTLFSFTLFSFSFLSFSALFFFLQTDKSQSHRERYPKSNLLASEIEILVTILWSSPQSYLTSDDIEHLVLLSWYSLHRKPDIYMFCHFPNGNLSIPFHSNCISAILILIIFFQKSSLMVCEI